jgi:GT2 family glycosyltransferase
MNPRLSIIIPVRNGIDFVARAIDSARAVPIDPLEIVVVDDGSTDGTSELLTGLAQADPRIVVIHRNRDHGASAARNEGISRAGAGIVCFLDADDFLCPAPIAERLRYHEAHRDVVLSFADYQTLLPDGTIEARFASYWPRFERHVGKRQGLVDLGGSAFRLLYGENPVCTSGTMVRRETLAALGGFSRDLRQAEDWEMWIRLSRTGRVVYSTHAEVLHTARPGSLSTDVEDRTRHVAMVVRRHCAYAVRHQPLAALAAFSTVATTRAESARLADRSFAAAAHSFAAFMLQPSRSRARAFARSLAVILGLRSNRIPTLTERASLASRCATK